MRRKVFVINTTAADGGNAVIDTGAANSPNPFGMNSLIESGKLIVAWQKKNSSVVALDSVAEARQVLNLTVTNVVPGQKYTLIREAPAQYLIGRDANQYGNTKRYSWTAPAVIADQAVAKAALIAAIIAKVNADSSNYATADSSDGGIANLRITEQAGYGLLPSYPGPASWMMTSAAGEITHVLTTPGKIARGNGNVMLANRAIWTLDGTSIRSGEEVYNFDGTSLPVSGKTYCTFVITEKYSMTDHGGTTPDAGNEIIVYVDETTAAHITSLKTALGA